MRIHTSSRKPSRLPAYALLALFACSACLSVACNLLSLPTGVRVFSWLMWGSLPLYFLSCLWYISTGQRGWGSRLFLAAVFFPLALFIFLALLMILSDALYIDRAAFVRVMTAPFIRDALYLSLVTSVVTVLLSLLFAIPMGYALSRFRFPGHTLADAIVDIPIVFPPLVAGLTLLVFFSQSGIGRWIENGLGWNFVFHPRGIVLCQFVVAASFAIRSAKSAFDDVDRRLEHVALTLGATSWGSFFRVSLPLAGGGIIAGAILTWARAFGIFGPLMIMVGSFRGKTEVLSTTIFLEQSVGNLETALAVALLMILVAMVALVSIRLVGGKVLVKL